MIVRNRGTQTWCPLCTEVKPKVRENHLSVEGRRNVHHTRTRTHTDTHLSGPSLLNRHTAIANVAARKRILRFSVPKFWISDSQCSHQTYFTATANGRREHRPHPRRFPNPRSFCRRLHHELEADSRPRRATPPHSASRPPARAQRDSTSTLVLLFNKISFRRDSIQVSAVPEYWTRPRLKQHLHFGKEGLHAWH